MFLIRFVSLTVLIINTIIDCSACCGNSYKSTNLKNNEGGNNDCNNTINNNTNNEVNNISNEVNNTSNEVNNTNNEVNNTNNEVNNTNNEVNNTNTINDFSKSMMPTKASELLTSGIFDNLNNNTFVNKNFDEEANSSKSKNQNNVTILIGLNNIGATCYMNSSLQALSKHKRINGIFFK